MNSRIRKPTPRIAIHKRPVEALKTLGETAQKIVACLPQTASR